MSVRDEIEQNYYLKPQIETNKMIRGFYFILNFLTKVKIFIPKVSLKANSDYFGSL